MAFIEKVNSPKDLKKLTEKELLHYADEVRNYIVDTVSERGGHLSSNLGAVELTIALHYAFDAPNDKILFDVGHQSYTHKIITGRRDEFGSLRTDGGISGFPNASESEYDHFTMGHSSTSLSLGVGMARARDIKGEKYSVVSVIGDGAFTGGMAFEALNDIGANKEKMIIVLNDNKMSIQKNVGAFSNYLAKLRLSKGYSSIKYKIKRGFSALPFFGAEMVSFVDKLKDNIKISLLPNKIFENLGVKYYGPLNGHDIPRLIDTFKRLKHAKGPVLLHVVTEKGKGVDEVMKAPEKYHGVSPKDAVSSDKNFSSVVGDTLCELARDDDKIVAVTAAMASGTGLDQFSVDFQKRYFDVGIAEQHAVTMCAGFAGSGLKPYFAVYSSFLQRAYDQIVHDVCIDKRAVTFLVDHAGVVGGDGVTHQGLFDISFLSSIPNMTIMQPKDGVELKNMIRFSRTFNAPLALRYSKSYKKEYENHTPVDTLCWEYIRKSDSEIAVLAVGNNSLDAVENIEEITVVNARVIKPLDETILRELLSKKMIITIEEGYEKGGFGESVRTYYSKMDGSPKVVCVAHPDKFIASVSKDKILYEAGITEENIRNIIKNA